MTLPHPKPRASFRKAVLALLGESYSDNTVSVCPKPFLKLFDDDHLAAMLLNQILYWSERTQDPEGWFYKSYADWQAELGLSEAQVRRIVQGDPRVKRTQFTLHDLGIETVVKKAHKTGAPTVHYRVNRDVFLETIQRLLGQGDPEQCQGSIPNNVKDRSLTLPGMDTEHCVGSSTDTETTSSESISEDQSQPEPTLHPDDDSDFQIFATYEKRFGHLKKSIQPLLRTQLDRLGAIQVREVLDRCVPRGHSWNYVVRALANELVAAAPAASNPQAWAIFTETELDEAPETVQETPLPTTERLNIPWTRFSEAGETVKDAWLWAAHQLQLQMDSGSFYQALQPAVLVDFEPDTHTFVLVAFQAYARDLLRYRLARLIKRVLGDVYGQPVEICCLLKEEWLERVGEGAA